ncbi:MAG: YbjN domain-containing protein [Planctomycetota bacterium]
MSNARATFDVVRSYLQEKGWKFFASEESGAFELTVTGRTSVLHVRVQVGYDPLLVSVAVGLPTIVPEERRAQVAEAVVRMNYGLLVGCFDFDMRDGTLGFRAALPVVDASATPEQFGAVYRSALATADRYHRAFCRLLYGDDLSPAEAVAEVEMAPAK